MFARAPRRVARRDLRDADFHSVFHRHRHLIPPTAAEISIEERSGDEATSVFDTRVAPEDAPAANFAFDVTPHELIAAIITDVGVLRPPFTESIARAVAERNA